MERGQERLPYLSAAANGDQSLADLVSKYAGDSVGEAGGKRFVFAYTNADVDALNRDIRALRKERSELGNDHILQTKDGPRETASSSPATRGSKAPGTPGSPMA